MDESTSDCFVCRKHQDIALMPGGPIASDDLVVVSHVSPRAPGLTVGLVQLGHLVVEPRRHAPDWAALGDNEASAVGLWCARAARALVTVARAERVYSATIGHTVAHLHVHLLPRQPGTPAEYEWHRLDEWPDGLGSEEQASEMAGQLRLALSGEGRPRG